MKSSLMIITEITQRTDRRQTYQFRGQYHPDGSAQGLLLFMVILAPNRRVPRIIKALGEGFAQKVSPITKLNHNLAKAARHSGLRSSQPWPSA